MLHSIKVKILLPVISQLIALLVLFGLVLIEMNHFVSGFVNLEQEVLSTTNQIRETRSLFQTQIQEWKNVLLRGTNNEDREKYWSRFQTSGEKIISLLQAQSNNTALNPGSIRKIKQLIEDYRRVLTQYRSGYQTYVERGYDYAQADAEVRGIDRPITVALNDIVTEIDKTVELKVAQLEEEAGDALFFTILLVIVVATVSVVGVNYFLTRSTIKPIYELNTLLLALSEGDYSKSVSRRSEDEIGKLIDTARVLKEKLSDTVSQVNVVSFDVTNAFDQLSAIYSDIEKGASIQSGVVQSLTDTMTRLSDISESNKLDSEVAQSSCEDTQNVASQCTKELNDSNISISELVSEMQEISTHINKLETDASEISQVLEVIRSIAEQTNLLALNAAIEAARAGEHGRGFSVVADEVRNLANRTQDSTMEIQQIIEKTQAGSRKAVNAMATGLEKTESTASSIVNANTVLNQIIDSFNQLKETISSVDNNADEQKVAAETLARDVEKLVELSEQLQSMAESDSISNAVNRASGDLDKLVNTLITTRTEDVLF